jgi:hypothetical protein
MRDDFVDQIYVPLPSTKKYDRKPPGMIQGGISALFFSLPDVLVTLKYTVEILLTE